MVATPGITPSTVAISCDCERSGTINRSMYSLNLQASAKVALPHLTLREHTTKHTVSSMLLVHSV